jgi:malate dehydrogenase (oxaloacetate-decarboxylating)
VKAFDFKIDPLTGEEYLEVYLRGRVLMHHPLLSKLSMFSQDERLSLELEGLLPAHISTMEEWQERLMEMYRRKPDDLERYIFLKALLDRSEVLFYALLHEHLVDMVPIVYTPTVGQACLQMSHIQRRYRGVYVTPQNIDHIDQICQSVTAPEINLVVVTDGERILGLGDLGADGMGIPVGKINLYVAAGGIHPACCLPVCLDVGTNNERLLADPLYLGLKQPRLTGDDYYQFVERFVVGVRRNYPRVLLQWEDFAKHHAFTLLDTYRERVLSFNDDIQGTGATALAALSTAMRILGTRFADHRFVLVGMGQAGVGISSFIRMALLGEGLSREEARARLFATDIQGLLLEGQAELSDEQRPFAQPRGAVAGWSVQSSDRIDFHEVVREAKATVLIGVSAQGGLFDADVLSQMARNTERPIVFALSNPTAKAECVPVDVQRAAGGRALVATGSPFPPVDWDGRALAVSQCNNMFVFPGAGLGALIAESPRVTDDMLLAASKALADMVTDDQRASGMLLPELADVQEASVRVATAVAMAARDAGIGRQVGDEDYERMVRAAQWVPHFAPYRPGPVAQR